MIQQFLPAYPGQGAETGITSENAENGSQIEADMTDALQDTEFMGLAQVITRFRDGRLLHDLLYIEMLSNCESICLTTLRNEKKKVKLRPSFFTTVLHIILVFVLTSVMFRAD